MECAVAQAAEDRVLGQADDLGLAQHRRAAVGRSAFADNGKHAVVELRRGEGLGVGRADAGLVETLQNVNPGSKSLEGSFSSSLARDAAKAWAPHVTEGSVLGFATVTVMVLLAAAAVTVGALTAGAADARAGAARAGCAGNRDTGHTAGEQISSTHVHGQLLLSTSVRNT